MRHPIQDIKLPHPQIVAILHVDKRRIGRSLPIPLLPGVKYLIGNMVKIGNLAYKMLGFGYELGQPVIHVRRGA